jgi:hypothetical protein
MLEHFPVQVDDANAMVRGEVFCNLSTLVAGSVECVEAALRQLGCESSEPDPYPATLTHQRHR